MTIRTNFHKSYGTAYDRRDLQFLAVGPAPSGVKWGSANLWSWAIVENSVPWIPTIRTSLTTSTTPEREWIQSSFFTISNTMYSCFSFSCIFCCLVCLVLSCLVVIVVELLLEHISPLTPILPSLHVSQVHGFKKHNERIRVCMSAKCSREKKFKLVESHSHPISCS